MDRGPVEGVEPVTRTRRLRRAALAGRHSHWMASPYVVAVFGLIAAGVTMDSLLTHGQNLEVSQLAEHTGAPPVSVFFFGLAVIVGLGRSVGPALRSARRRRPSAAQAAILVSATLAWVGWWLPTALIALGITLAVDFARRRQGENDV